MLVYRLLLALAAPALRLVLLWRRLRGRESRADIAERLGQAPAGAPGALWLHGASNGELASVRGLAERLAGAGWRLHVTANTVTGRAFAQGWGLTGLTAGLAPLDTRGALGRHLDRLRPAALLTVENELWPNRFDLAATRGLPVLVVGARMSERSAARWARLPRLIRPLLARITALSAQDARSAARFAALGLPQGAMLPVTDLKTAPAAAIPPEAAALAPLLPRELTVLAASTHPGEEEIVLDAFAMARAQRPELKLILAPRHARRGPEVAGLIAARHLGFATRSAGEAPTASVFLADTMGEMALWYALAGITFTGGSLVPKGGHTPHEPAAFGSAILHGPEVSNFREVYAALDAAGGAMEAGEAGVLAAAILALGDPARRRTQAEAACTTLDAARGGDVEALAAALRARLPPPPAGI